MNYVNTEAPAEWERFTDRYQAFYDLTPYHGRTIQLRFEFISPVEPVTSPTSYLYIDDLVIQNFDYQHDIETGQPIIPFPLTVGLINHATVTFTNQGSSRGSFLGRWFLGESAFQFPAQPELQPGESITLLLDPDPEDGVDGWIPQSAGQDVLYALAVMAGDENTENNSSDSARFTVQPAGSYEFGYDNRIPRTYDQAFVQGEGPLVHFTPWQDMGAITLGDLSLTTIRLLWQGDIPFGVDYSFIVHIFDGGATPGGELLSYPFETDFFQQYPVWQELNIQGLNLPVLSRDFWLWVEFTDPQGIPHIIESDGPRIGEGHHFRYDGATMEESDYDYFVHVAGLSEVAVDEPVNETLPSRFAMMQPYPNPFNSELVIPFAIPELDNMNLSVYNIQGQKVYNFSQSYHAGFHRLSLNAGMTGLSSGIYIIRLNYRDKQELQKVYLVK